MRAPDQFLARLREEFRDRLRIRWADTQGEWHLEQKVGRGIFDPPLPSHKIAPHQRELQYEKRERARDGYAFVMAIRPGDRMPCPACGLTMHVPVMELTEAKCGWCLEHGRDTRLMACYFPLGEVLIDHLKKIDPERDGIRRQRDEADLANARKLAREERAADSELRDSLFDAAVDQIPKWGYTGREAAWEQ